MYVTLFFVIVAPVTKWIAGVTLLNGRVDNRMLANGTVAWFNIASVRFPSVENK